MVPPHGLDDRPPISSPLRRRIALELAALTIGTPLFLLYGPRDSALYVTLAALFGCFIALTARETRQRIWGDPVESKAVRMCRSVFTLTVLTAPTAILFFGWSVAQGRHVAYGNMLLALGLYFLWAGLQQAIFQFYLHGRLRALLPSVAPSLLWTINGLAYGLVHFPKYELMALTGVAGVIWSYSYRRDRLLLPIAASHAVLGTGYYYWVVGDDMIVEIAARLAGTY